MPHSTRRAVLQLDFIIVGGGISGLATAYALASSGHKVRVFEAGHGLDRRAGGIRIPPNLTRILVEWGLAQQLQEKGSKYYGYMFYNLETGEKIAYAEWQKDVIKESGAPFYMMHHQDLIKMLYELAVSAGAEVHFGSRMASVSLPPPVSCRWASEHSRPTTPSHFTTISSSRLPQANGVYDHTNGIHERTNEVHEHTNGMPNPINGHNASNSDTVSSGPAVKPSIILTNGEIHEADIVIGADGYRSIVRSTMLGKNDENDPRWLYGTCVYTSTLHAEDRIGDETLREFATAGSPMWAGTRQNALSYPIRQGKEYSVHFMLRQQLQDDDPEGWDVLLSPDLLTLDTCESRVKAMRQHLKDVVRVRRRDRPAAKDWIDASERVILIGEAAHPVLLCGTHNCSAVIEDAAVLGSLFSRLRQQDQIEPLLYAYQDLRQYRADVLFSFDKLNRTVSQLPPGPERDERDQRLRMGQPKHEEIWDENALAIQWAGISEIWGYNAFDAADDWWVHWGLLRERSRLGDGKTLDPIEVTMRKQQDAFRHD